MARPVHVLVGGVHGRAVEPGRVDAEAVRLPVREPGRGAAVFRRAPSGGDRRAVELVPGRPRAGGAQQAVLGQDEGLVAQRQPRGHDRLGVQGADHRHPVDAAAQVEQPGALGDGRQTRRDRVGDGAAQGCVRAQLGGVHLGEAAAEVEPRRALGQRGVDQRVDLDRLAARGAQQLLGLGVAERERPPGSHRDARARRGGRRDLGRRVPGLDVEGGGTVGDRQDGLEVDVRADLLGEALNGRGRLRALARRHQPEVARGGLDAGVAGEHPEHGEPGGLERGSDLVDEPGRARLVEDDAGQAYAGLEGVQAVDEGGGRPGHPRDVDDDDERGVDQAGHVRGGGEPLAAHPAVEEPHDALDHGDVRGRGDRGPVQQQRGELIGPAQVRVEVAPWPSGGERVVARVDVVRTDLEPRDLEPLGPQRPHQPGGHGRLPVPGRGRGDQQPRQERPLSLSKRCPEPVEGGPGGVGVLAHHSMPR